MPKFERKTKEKVMPMNDNPDEINAADRQIESTIWKEGQNYAARNARSKEENKGRAESRDRIKQTGISTNAYHTAVGLIKKLSASELKDWRRDFDLVLKVLGSKQQELFPEESLKIAKRESDKKAKEAEAKTKAGPDADTNPRSDPNKGGAKPRVAGTGDEADVKSNVPAPNPPDEESEGAAALDAGLPKTKKAQSQIVAEIAAAAGTDKPLH